MKDSIRIEAVAQMAARRDLLIREKQYRKDIPANYFDGVLDMYNECVRIIRGGIDVKSERSVRPRGNTVCKKDNGDV